MTCGNVFENFERLWREAGLPPAYGLVSRIGHGGGLDVTEPPSISKDNAEIIMPGMILHLEPKLESTAPSSSSRRLFMFAKTGSNF
jgi:Xaa-Pro aminopeptidase